MKNIYVFVKIAVLALIAGFAASCNKSDNYTLPAEDMRVITVGTAATRTTIGYEGSDVSHLEWVDGDKVAYVTDAPGDVFKVAEVNSNLFTAEIPAASENIYVIYPVGENEGKSLAQVRASLASEIVQIADEDFNGELLPMYAVAPVPTNDRVDVVYECMASVLRFTVFGEGFETETLKSVTLSAAEPLVGDFTIDLNSDTFVFDGIGSEIVVNYQGEGEDVLLSSSHDIYMVVPSTVFTDLDLVVTTDVNSYYWLDGSMDLTNLERRLYRVELDLGDSNGMPEPEQQLFTPVLSLDEVTDEGHYLIAVKMGGKYYVTNNVPTDQSNYYYLSGVEVVSNENGVIYDETSASYTWQITHKDGGYEFYSDNMAKNGNYGVLLISQGGEGMLGNENGYEGKAWFVAPSTVDGYSDAQQSRRYWDIELDGQGSAVLRNKYDRGVGMFPCYKYCTSHQYFTLCFEGGEDKADITLLKLN